MTTKRLIVLLLTLLVGLSGVFCLPVSSQTEPVGIKLSLPEYVGNWYGVDQPITEQELTVLAGDTEFARKEYTNGAGDSIFVSIVLSGHDLDNSIHRPERCLPAQGWTIADSRRLDVALPNGRELQITRLRNVREFPGPGARMLTVYNLNYYWFVGYHHVTASHLERTFLDIQDRVLKGYNQRWAYITIASAITRGWTRFGRSESETDAMIQDFIGRIFPLINAPADGQAGAQESEMPARRASH